MRLDKNSENMFLPGGIDYPLKWIDCLVTVSLDPDNLDVGSIADVEVDTIVSGIKNEYIKLKQVITTQIFTLFDEQQVQLVINRYHASLVGLLDQVLENRNAVAKGTRISEMYAAVLTCLDNLLAFLEKRFAEYISLDERVPATYVATIKGEILKTLESVSNKSKAHYAAMPVLKFVIGRIRKFAKESHRNEEVTFRRMFYKKELAEKLDDLDLTTNHPDPFSVLDELLILMNFNSKTYIKLLTRSIGEQVAAELSIPLQLDMLQYFYKTFNQLPIKPNVIFNPKYHDLKAVMNGWFEQEISYLERRLRNEPELEQVRPQNEKNVPPENKVVCALSVDQISLILRAADEARMFVASSLSQVYKSIVPYLSTANKSELSPNSVRSKSYSAEDRDKEIAIETLEKMIKKIKGY